MASLKLQHLCKRYGDVVAVDDVTLDIPDDEFLVLVGPSGCGKSTTLRMVAGLEDISSGDVYIGDRRVTNVHPKDRDIAMVFQSYALYPHMSVYENLAVGLRLRKVAATEIERRITETTAFLGIDGFLNRKPRELSGGQRQRVALGRAIVREPKVFLMDEPLSNLDAQVRAKTRIELMRIHQKIKNTVMYVTHDQVEAMTMGDRIVVMKDGFVQQVAPPKVIYDRPANAFVAGFMGSPPINFFDAELERNGDTVWLRGAGFATPVNGAKAAALGDAATRAVTVGVRPEDVLLNAPIAAGQTIRARADIVETLGAEQHVGLVCEGSSLLARVPADPAVAPGQRFDVSFDVEKLHVFDRASGVAYA